MSTNQATFEAITELSGQIASEIRARKGFVNINDASYEATEQQRANVLLALFMSDDALLSESICASLPAAETMISRLLSVHCYEHLEYIVENTKGHVNELYKSIMHFRNALIYCNESEHAINNALRLSPLEQLNINEAGGCDEQ